MSKKKSLEDVLNAGMKYAEKAKELAEEAKDIYEDVAPMAKDAIKVGKQIYDKASPFVKEKGKEAAEFTKKKANEAKEFTKETVIPGAKKAAKATKDKTVELASKAGDMALQKMDVNKDGVFDFKDVLTMSFKIPGVNIDRAEFLQKTFLKECKQETIDNIIETTPAKAGIKKETVDKLVDNVITYERNLVTGVSTGLGVVPGGVGVAVTTTVADISQYYGYMIRVAQKLLYLYGFPQLDFDKDNQPLDDGTMNMLVLCLGAMNGIHEAVAAIRGLAKGLGNGITKTIMKTALTKGTIYPIIKKVWSFMGGKMTKEVLSQGLSKGVLIVGGLVSGGITFLSFQKCCENFKDAISDTILSNPDNHMDDADIIDIDVNN